jgi:pimeloyl-ACP methyl ester carboxylesterase
MMDKFETAEIQTGETSIFVRWSGSGLPILLLHGFPQTHLMWRSVAPLLARSFTVVCADLRGYGRSGCPASAADPGHDRGGRVAYRMALDHPSRVDRVAVLDILPTGRYGTEPMRDSRLLTGLGHCLLSLRRFRNVCWQSLGFRMRGSVASKGCGRATESRCNQDSEAGAAT